MLKKINRSIYALANGYRAAAVFVAIASPVIIGVLASNYDQIIKISGALFWVPFLLLVAFAVALAWVTVAVDTSPQLYSELQEEQKTRAILTQDAVYFSLLQEELIAWNAVIRGYAKNKIKDKDKLKEAIKTCCTMIVENRRGYFNFDHREKWNFAVYLWDEQKELLIPFWRDHSCTYPSKDIGREWENGQGHVGHVFRNKEHIITSDASDPSISALMSANHKAKDYDNETYRSYVPWPILHIEKDQQPFGVAVATSDKVGRFDRANAVVIHHLAVTLATLMETGYDSP